MLELYVCKNTYSLYWHGLTLPICDSGKNKKEPKGNE
jgi:hypothetical protein